MRGNFYRKHEKLDEQYADEYEGCGNSRHIEIELTLPNDVYYIKQRTNEVYAIISH